MEIKDVKKRLKEDTKSIPLNLRITQKTSSWLRKHEVSPQAVIDLSIKKLMEKEK